MPDTETTQSVIVILIYYKFHLNEKTSFYFIADFNLKKLFLVFFKFET